MNILLQGVCVDIYIQGIFLGVQLLGYKVVLGLTSWGNAKLFPRAIVLFNIPISNTREFQLLQLSNLRVSKGERKELPGHNLRKIHLVPLKCREDPWPVPPTPSRFHCHMATHPDVPAPQLKDGQGTSPRQGRRSATDSSLCPAQSQRCFPHNTGHFCPMASNLLCLPISCPYKFCSRS